MRASGTSCPGISTAHQASQRRSNWKQPGLSAMGPTTMKPEPWLHAWFPQMHAITPFILGKTRVLKESLLLILGFNTKDSQLFPRPINLHFF